MNETEIELHRATRLYVGGLIAILSIALLFNALHVEKVKTDILNAIRMYQENPR